MGQGKSREPYGNHSHRLRSLLLSLDDDFTRAHGSPPISTDRSLHGEISTDFNRPLTPRRYPISTDRSLHTDPFSLTPPISPPNRASLSRNHSHRLRSLVVSPDHTDLSSSVHTDLSADFNSKPGIAHSSVLRFEI